MGHHKHDDCCCNYEQSYCCYPTNPCGGYPGYGMYGGNCGCGGFGGYGGGCGCGTGTGGFGGYGLGLIVLLIIIFVCGRDRR